MLTRIKHISIQNSNSASKVTQGYRFKPGFGHFSIKPGLWAPGAPVIMNFQGPPGRSFPRVGAKLAPGTRGPKGPNGPMGPMGTLGGPWGPWGPWVPWGPMEPRVPWVNFQDGKQTKVLISFYQEERTRYLKEAENLPRLENRPRDRLEILLGKSIICFSNIFSPPRLRAGV